MRLLVAALAALGGFAINGCASGGPEQLPYVERPAEMIYRLGMERMEKRRFAEAALMFDEVERQHPYDEWARRAMMMSAFANYQLGEYPAAIATAERYIALYPGGETTAYAYYLIGLSHYEQILDVGRDQRTTEQALAALRQVERRFPRSDYARDARLKIDLTLDHLAGKQMEVGRYYLRSSHYVAAINRFRSVIADYQTTSHVPEALHRMVEAYVALGIIDEATQIAAVLGYNFPGDAWYEDTYSLLTGEGIVLAETGQTNEELELDKRSWWDRTLGRAF